MLPAPSTGTPDEPEALLSAEDVQAAIVESLLAEPIEEWMAFLHPSQARLVRRSFNGPARIRGAPGTGKIVVGLHRAAYLARTRPGSVLVTTFIRMLPGGLHQLLTRMAPDVADQVEFVHVHVLANRLLDERGVTVHLNPTQAENVWERVRHEHGHGGPLDTDLFGPGYWRDEVRPVLKGRDITRFEEYADLARTGRRYSDHRGPAPSGVGPVPGLRRGSARPRRARLPGPGAAGRGRGAPGTADRALRRGDRRRGAGPVLRHDQVAALVRGGQSNGFTLIGDGQQAIYPGGYTLAEAGISVAGRGVVMDVNYRNTAQIVAFASRMVDGDEYPDTEGVIACRAAPESVPRTGPAPRMVTCGDVRQHDQLLVDRVREVVVEVGTGYGDVEVLCVRLRGVDRMTATLQRGGIPTVDLLAYDGTPVDAAKVGTVKQAEVLEFKQVLLGDVEPARIGGAPPPAETAERER